MGPPQSELDPIPGSEVPVVLEAGTRFEGVLAIPGAARIAGELKGRIVGPGPLWIEAGGSVQADLDLDTVIVAGRVRGHIRATARIELLASAWVEGDLAAPVLRVAEGCHWNGRSSAGTSPGSDSQ